MKDNILQACSVTCASLDNTFKLAAKATVVDGNGAHSKLMGGGILSVINECNEIIAWVRTLNFHLYSS